MATKPKKITVDLPFNVFSYEADHDYLLARWINFAGGGFQSRAGFLAQQACEKYMKAVLVQATKQYLQTHRLLDLAKECRMHHALFANPDVIADLTKFDAFEQVGRYGMAAKHDPLSVKTPHYQTAGFWQWTPSYLPSLDRFAFNTRRLLDFSKISFNDSLASILRQDNKTSMQKLWVGHPPIFEVLTRGNAYFTPPEQPDA